MRTRVCITVDTEFTIAGAFRNSKFKPVAEQRVWCRVNGQSEGLGFMLNCFSQHGITGTFFVEALHRHYFKHDPMLPIIKRLYAEGQEIQLHAHPCWSIFQHEDWQDRVRENRRVDDFFGRSEDDSVRLIEYGKQAFREWGIPAPTVFRSASLQHDDTLYRALAKAGIPYSSNVGIAIFNSGDANYRLYSGRHQRHGVLECPILTFSDWRLPGKQHLKSLTITGTSFAETCTLLERAHAAGVEQVVILTHPFEYVQTLDFTVSQMRRHRVNQQRLKRLCQYLESNREQFLPCGMEEAASAPLLNNSEKNLLLKGRAWQALPRMAGQLAYERYANCRLALQEFVGATTEPEISSVET